LVENKKCDDLGIDQILKFTIKDHEFTIPLANIAVDVTQNDVDICQLQIALLAKASADVIVLGSAWFTAYVGMFDAENERIGFAHSVRALEGSSIVCIGGEDCPEPEDGGGSPGATRLRLIALVAAILLIAIAVCIGICWCRNRAERDDDADRDVQRSMKGKKGYSIKDEKEDDSDEDDNLSIDYAKPSMN